MHTIKLHVEDNVYQKVITLLSSLKGLKIEENSSNVPTNEEPLDFSNYKVKAFEDIRDEW